MEVGRNTTTRRSFEFLRELRDLDLLHDTCMYRTVWRTVGLR